MKKKYDEIHAISFIKGLNTLTGISQRRLEKYASENNIFNILEHPNVVEANKQQLEKIGILNEFISSYKILKLQEKENKLTLDSSSISGQYFTSILSGIKDKEKFMVAFLDNGNHIIETRIISEGTIGETVVYPRAILKAALDCDCKSLIIAHNHPGGNLKPSRHDIAVTETLISIFSPLQIKVQDHIIVAGLEYYSMAEQGQIQNDKVGQANYEAISMNEKEVGYESDFLNISNYSLESEEECEWEI